MTLEFGVCDQCPDNSLPCFVSLVVDGLCGCFGFIEFKLVKITVAVDGICELDMNCGTNMSIVKRWAVTYTKHLKQKRKVYQDGVLELCGSGKKVRSCIILNDLQ